MLGNSRKVIYLYEINLRTINVTYVPNVLVFLFSRLSGNGNGTCLLGLDLPKSGPYDDPEYDLFMKILQCRDRTSE